MTVTDTLQLAWKTVRSNKTRTRITVAIIALGICALIWFLTTLKAASNSLNASFSSMGANSFSIRFKDRKINFGGPSPEEQAKAEKKSNKPEKKSNLDKPILYEQAKRFKENYNFPGALVGLAIRATSNIVINTDTKKTNPDNNLLGVDENYLALNGYSIAFGRNFTPTEVTAGTPVCLLGSAVAKKLFGDTPQQAIDKNVKVDKIPYKVIGVLAEKSSSAFMRSGQMVLTTLNMARKNYVGNNASFNVGVMVPNQKLLPGAVDEAIGTFRPIRGLEVEESNNFYIDKSDSVAKAFQNNLRFIEYGIIGIAIITLIASSIGLMNIMLVAVTERTKEIGLIKAIGGQAKDIRNQFISEAIVISILGAIWGIVVGVILGNLIGLLLKSGVVLIWGWIFGGIFLCTVVGLFAGLYPALKAAKLNPIAALRYE
jgi:putative ABC transport system permease protein